MLTGQKHVVDLLQQLLDCTVQLARCEEDPNVEIAVFATACEQHLLALQQLDPSQGGETKETVGGFGAVSTSDFEQLAGLKGMIQTLVSQTDRCIGVLGRQLERTARDLASLRSSQTALRAYHGQHK